MNFYVCLVMSHFLDAKMIVLTYLLFESYKLTDLDMTRLKLLKQLSLLGGGMGVKQ